MRGHLRQVFNLRRVRLVISDRSRGYPSSASLPRPRGAARCRRWRRIYQPGTAHVFSLSRRGACRSAAASASDLASPHRRDDTTTRRFPIRRDGRPRELGSEGAREPFDGHGRGRRLRSHLRRVEADDLRRGAGPASFSSIVVRRHQVDHVWHFLATLGLAPLPAKRYQLQALQMRSGRFVRTKRELSHVLFCYFSIILAMVIG